MIYSAVVYNFMVIYVSNIVLLLYTFFIIILFLIMYNILLLYHHALFSLGSMTTPTHNKHMLFFSVEKQPWIRQNVLVRSSGSFKSQHDDSNSKTAVKADSRNSSASKMRLGYFLYLMDIFYMNRFCLNMFIHIRRSMT